MEKRVHHHLNQHGLSILTVVTILMLLLLYVAVASQLVSERTVGVGTLLNAERALTVAEGGLQVARYQLQQDWNTWSDSAAFPAQSIGSGTSTVTMTDDDDGDGNTTTDSNNRVIVTVTGTDGGASRTIRATVSRYGAALSSAIYAAGDIDVGGSATVTGDTVESGGEIPGIDTAAAIAAAQANPDNGYASRADGNYFQGDFPGGSQKPTSLNGVMFVDRFSGGSPADVHLSSGLATTASDPAFLIVIGNIHFSGTVSFNGLIYVAPGGTVDVDVTGSVTITGGIITSGDADLSGSSNLAYDAESVITDTTLGLLTGEGASEVLSWEEYYP